MATYLALCAPVSRQLLPGMMAKMVVHVATSDKVHCHLLAEAGPPRQDTATPALDLHDGVAGQRASAGRGEASLRSVHFH